MQRNHLTTLLTTLLALAASGCTTSAIPPTPEPILNVPDTTPSVPVTASYLRFTPGLYRYQFSQTTQISGDGPTDTLPGTITTQALMKAEVTVQPDSSFTVVISFDSIRVNTQGPIPTHQMGQLTVLDSVVRGAFSRTGSSSQVYLADSLCAYSQFVTTAQELLLPQLGFEAPSPMRRSLVDTTTQRSCRAGTNIEMTTIRELRDVGRNPGEIELRQKTGLHGLGLLRRDSVTVSGSIATRGRVQFATMHRLPTLIQSESEGTIIVRLGSARTHFRQHSTQETRLITTSP